MAAFDTLISDTRGFLGALDQNNTRDWWQAHKADYDTKLKAPALALLDVMAPLVADLSGLEVSGKLFRPHRDVRFSKDKTPYNTHLHMMWTLATRARQDVVFFFGIGLDYVTAGAGTMELNKEVLADWRKFVDLDTKRVMGIVSAVEARGATLRAPALKRVPPPYDKDHEGARLLRMKGVVAGIELPATGALVPALTGAFTDLWPLNDLLIGVAEA